MYFNLAFACQPYPSYARIHWEGRQFVLEGGSPISYQAISITTLILHRSTMETARRSQLHSCDPCRKGKRGCDAPVRNDFLPQQARTLTGNSRKIERITVSAPAPTAKNGRRNAPSTSFQ
jgi:hypothetical protein